MNALSRPDLGRFDLEEGSLLAQAVGLGVEWGKLPAHTPEGVRAFFQACAVTYARRYRTGIAVEAAVLNRGLKQAVVSVELALRERCDDDLEASVDVLAGSDFEALRRSGWEIAFRRLEAVREGSRRFLESASASFLQDYVKECRVWSTLTPETWQAPDDAEDSGVRELDPVTTYARWREVEARMAVLRLLPEKAFKRFRSATGGRGTFGDVARALCAALVLGVDRMVLRRSDLLRLQDRVTSGAFPKRDFAAIAVQIEERLEANGVESALRQLARRAIEEELVGVAGKKGIEGLFVVDR